MKDVEIFYQIIIKICKRLYKSLHLKASGIKLQIGVDFFASASSPNRPLEMIYPSIGSICNETKLMRNETDFENLLAEFQEFPHEKMLKG